MTEINQMTTNPFDDDKLHEECGVFGIFGHKEAAAHAALGLHALQHRGQEACGIFSYDGQQFHSHKGMGLVGDNFSSTDVIGQLKGNSAIGHVRYATTGGTVLRNVQPLFAEFEFGGLAIAHNGNLTNTQAVRRTLVRRGCIFQSDMDTEVIVHLVAVSLYATVEDRIIDALRQIEGAYSLVAMTKDSLIGVRDPNGVRPLCLGRLDDTYILASESCAFDIIGADFVRDVEPGEVVIIDSNGVRSIKPFGEQKGRFCVFEYIYFARPDSIIENRSVYEVRKAIGAELARENGVEADMVVPVPDSGVPSSIGYAAEANIAFELGIIRNHYVGRTFIEPTQEIRHLGVRMKHNANISSVKGKRIILVDDSIVRGTTSKKIVDMMRQAGAAEVHMRISSPPTAWPCFYGIDTPKREKLLAGQYNIEEMAEHIGADSLAFISIDGMYRAVGEAKRNNDDPQFCDACFTGEYPTRLQDEEDLASDEMQPSLPLLAEKGK
ncbi:Amidophosphoribosyltransferase [Candidatus Terasakiella magnetica]|uniref:Amidophosphoribosyltransferase n=1 Tax=Candidatus Terasakiella magnetica TaxID=1867952 RepID=A0A1C3RJS4_9PROT|nr:amidophosphoribosyltransferase [Candidatus Terasakiella magnetica]SCA57540.1 Amidophosphoribosyltransferase [Candidatus Terasakiella magnetica]